MRFPDAPLALLIALVPTFVLLGIVWWRVRNGRGLSAFQGAAFAVGISLAAAVVTVSSTYVFRPLWAFRAQNWLLIGPLGTYLIVLLIVARKIKIESSSLVIWGVVGLVPLFFIGFYAWLLAACSFGECL